MNRLPRVSGREWFGALSKVGFYIRRQQGSDIIMRRDDPFGQVVVPDQRELDTGTLRAIVRQASLGVEEFSHLL